MSNYKEALIMMNGEPLSFGNSMTIRVALEGFSSELKSEGLGDDEHGKKMVELYEKNINEIRKIMYK